MNEVLLIISLLIFKHFVVDFPLQTPYQWMNKGTYGHMGGILHASLHGLASAIVLVMFTPKFLSLAAFDALVHYHIDWAKMNINKHYGWKADTHPQFWTALGVDQLLHYMTYVIMVANV